MMSTKQTITYTGYIEFYDNKYVYCNITNMYNEQFKIKIARYNFKIDIFIFYLTNINMMIKYNERR
jgi:ribonucleotide reductase alpha subunit